MIRGLPQIIRDYQEPFGSRDQFNYGVNLSYQNQGNETTAGANLTWNAPVATVMAVIVSRVLIDRLEPVFQGALSPGRGR
ncbi:putative outer membrane usher protein [Escherichia coli]|uniref:Putative outer membrane usher protein n=1 Tax=Escherichia coli TaxID=562 RepID=A0A376U8S2_ECOLX|nr:putative outer membrane usher protein [Escherichia coli]